VTRGTGCAFGRVCVCVRRGLSGEGTRDVDAPAGQQGDEGSGRAGARGGMCLGQQARRRWRRWRRALEQGTRGATLVGGDGSEGAEIRDVG
jgi:hypothetical protein